MRTIIGYFGRRGVWGWRTVCRRFCGSPEEFEAVYARLKTTACPHCKRVGTLIRHGFLRGYDEHHSRQKAVRAGRIFCNNRKQSIGCGRTFSVWAADKIKRLFLTAAGLWRFLKQAVESGNKLQAFRSLRSGLSDSAPYRIWKRFREAQSAIRTALGRSRRTAPNRIRTTGRSDPRSSRNRIRRSSLSDCRLPGHAANLFRVTPFFSSLSALPSPLEAR